MPGAEIVNPGPLEEVEDLLLHPSPLSTVGVAAAVAMVTLPPGTDNVGVASRILTEGEVVGGSMKGDWGIVIFSVVKFMVHTFPPHVKVVCGTLPSVEGGVGDALQEQ